MKTATEFAERWMTKEDWLSRFVQQSELSLQEIENSTLYKLKNWKWWTRMKWWYHVIELDFEAHALRERFQLNFQSYFKWIVQQHAHC